MAHDGPMSAILYPVAASAEEALARPKGRAAREREAAAVGGGPVAFVTEETGPAFASREAALDAYAGLVEDARPGRGVQVAPEDQWRRLVERIEGDAPARPVEPVFSEGRRWPNPAGAGPRTVFRLAVSYWRTGGEAPRAAGPQARAVRRKSEAAALDAAQLRALAQQPLRPVKPQQPLDVGLFEAPAPEAPHILIPDE
jgi:hypothetical protein